MAQILTKITDQNIPFYINAKYEENAIEMVILQNNKAWKCFVSEQILNEWCKKHQKPFSDYSNLLKEYLKSPSVDGTLCLNNNEFVVYQSLNKGRKKFFSINLEEIDYVSTVEETLVRFYDENRIYRNKIEVLEAQQKILDSTNAEYRRKLQEFIERKEYDDEQLYSNFVQVLNEKKRKIQHLTELLEAFRNDRRSTVNPSPVETKHRKRKKDDESPPPPVTTSTNQRKEILSESDESNYEGEEEMEQEQTTSSDNDSDRDNDIIEESHDTKTNDDDNDDFVLPKRVINTEIKPVEIKISNTSTVQNIEPEVETVANKRKKPNLDDTQELLDAI